MDAVDVEEIEVQIIAEIVEDQIQKNKNYMRDKERKYIQQLENSHIKKMYGKKYWHLYPLLDGTKHNMLPKIEDFSIALGDCERLLFCDAETEKTQTLAPLYRKMWLENALLVVQIIELNKTHALAKEHERFLEKSLLRVFDTISVEKKTPVLLCRIVQFECICESVLLHIVKNSSELAFFDEVEFVNTFFVDIMNSRHTVLVRVVEKELCEDAHVVLHALRSVVGMFFLIFGMSLNILSADRVWECIQKIGIHEILHTESVSASARAKRATYAMQFLSIVGKQTGNNEVQKKLRKHIENTVGASRKMYEECFEKIVYQ